MTPALDIDRQPTICSTPNVQVKSYIVLMCTNITFASHRLRNTNYLLLILLNTAQNASSNFWHEFCVLRNISIAYSYVQGYMENSSLLVQERAESSM